MTEAQMFGIGYWIVIAVVVGAAKLCAHVSATTRKRNSQDHNAGVAPLPTAKAGPRPIADRRRRAA